MMDAVTNAFLIIVFVWKFAPAILKSCMGFWGAGASNISYWKYATYCSRMRNCECIHFEK